MVKKILNNNQSELTYRFKSRIIISIIVIISIFSIISARLVYLQIYQHDRYRTLSNKNQIRVLPLKPKRGLIYDRNGVLLAENVPVHNLEIIIDHVKEFDNIIERLGEIIQLSANDISSFYTKLQQRQNEETIPIKQKLTDEEIAKFAVNQYQFSGVLIKARLIRHYPFGSSLAHVLGYVLGVNSQDGTQINRANYTTTGSRGMSGIEKYYEESLHGKLGYEEVERDSAGHTVRVLNRAAPIPGNDIYLTIDSRLQMIAEKSLGEQSGAVVVLDPNDGEVLALASAPNYDLNLFIQGMSYGAYDNMVNSKDRPFYNRAVNGQYPPASTIKPFIAIEALDSKIVTPKYRIFDRGYFQLPNSSYSYRDWKKKGHGWINMHRAIVVSCDTYFYNLAHMMGIQSIQKVLGQFGFGALTGIDLEGESAGIVPGAEWKQLNRHLPWYPGDTIITGIGQGYTLVTPLQLAAATATIAARGSSYKPHIVLKQILTDGETKNIFPQKNSVLKLQNNEVWNEIIAAMDEVTGTLEGTGRNFGQKLSYPVAAKTGTAQVISSNQHERLDNNSLPQHLRDHSLFIAFAPIENPEIAIAVIIENSTKAPHVAREVMDGYFLKEIQ